MWNRPIRLLVLLLVVGGLCAGPADAQDEDPPEVEGYGEVPTIPAVESVFSDGLRAYEQGKYEVALRLFENVLSQYRFNRRTTIALLLGGHSRFQLGRFEEAVRTYDRLIEEHPESRYVSEAERARSIAREELAEPCAPRRRIVTEWSALPLRDEHRTLTQALFNGIRVAADEHNTD
jgi:outer membrane protein assembly factor BamD (BamD/ComL family)